MDTPDSNTDRIHMIRDQMTFLYNRAFFGSNVIQNLKSRQTYNMYIRHCVRAMLLECNNATLTEIATAEGLLIGEKPLDHSTIINSKQMYENLKEQRGTDELVYNVFRKVERCMKALKQKESEPAKSVISQLQSKNKEELLDLFKTLIEWDIVAPDWVDAAIMHNGG